MRVLTIAAGGWLVVARAGDFQVRDLVLNVKGVSLRKQMTLEAATALSRTAFSSPRRRVTESCYTPRHSRAARGLLGPNRRSVCGHPFHKKGRMRARIA
jgi:hypothetical protein